MLATRFESEGSEPGEPRIDRFGKYIVLRSIGSGGMAEVYKCRLSGIGGFDKLVVVKRIRPEHAEDPDFIKMFLDEARVAANLSHPNIVQTYEIDEVHGLPYIAMEYVRGPTFGALIRAQREHGRRSLGVAAKIVSGICEGLHYAHHALDNAGEPLGIIHRDVSPQNVLVSMDGVPKLVDFGVAKARGRLAVTQAGTLKGKLKYMAPEQFRRGEGFDHRVDVFSAGVCLYLASTGQLPYRGSELEVLQAAAAGSYPKPSELIADFPAELERIILWAMAPDAQARCSDAHVLHEALEAFVASGPYSCTTRGVAEHLRKLSFKAEVETDGTPSRGASAPQVTHSRSESISGPGARSEDRSWPSLGAEDRSGPSFGAEGGSEPRICAEDGSGPGAGWEASESDLPSDVDLGLRVAAGSSDSADNGELSEVREAPVAAMGFGMPERGVPLSEHALLPRAEERPGPSPTAGGGKNPRTHTWVAALGLAGLALTGLWYVRAQRRPPAAPTARAAPAVPSAPAARAKAEPGARQPAETAAPEVRAVEPPTVAPPPSRPAVRYGKLTVLADRPAAVFVDGESWGRTPVQRRKMPEGTYRLELRQKGYVNQERTVQIAGGRDVRLVMKLVRAAAPPRPVETRTGLEGSSARDAEAPSPTQASLPTAPQAREPEPAPLVAAAPRTEQAPPAREEPPAPAVTRPAVVAAPAAPVAALPKASGVASDCPDDARPLGAAPPQGHEVWCQLPSGLKHGRATRWYATGQKAEEGEYRNGKKNGRWIEWYENGGERARTEWRKGVKAW